MYFLYDLLKNSQSHIVSLSDRIKKEFVRRGIDSTNVSVLPCAIDTDAYTIDDEALHPDRSVVVGKLEPRKDKHFYKERFEY